MSPKAGGVRLTAAQNNLWADSSKLVRGGRRCIWFWRRVIVKHPHVILNKHRTDRHQWGEAPGSASPILILAAGQLEDTVNVLILVTNSKIINQKETQWCHSFPTDETMMNNTRELNPSLSRSCDGLTASHDHLNTWSASVRHITPVNIQQHQFQICGLWHIETITLN